MQYGLRRVDTEQRTIPARRFFPFAAFGRGAGVNTGAPGPSPRFVAGGYTPFRPLRGRVPTRGRRSKPSSRFFFLSDTRFPCPQNPLARPRRRGSVTPWSLPVSGSRQTICIEPVCQL